MKPWATLLILLSSSAFAHGNHHHGAEAAKPVVPETPKQEEVFQEINRAYVQRVKPIFVSKCYDCHSDRQVWPWYYKIPGVKQYLEHDVAEGREHLDFSKDYPFISHATPIEDLDAIKKEIEEGEMPPFLYRLGHPDSAITADEKKLIFDWVDWSRTQLAGLKK